MSQHIAQNLLKIQQDITSMAKHYGRSEQDIALVAVSKFQSIEMIEEAIRAGQYRFGENRVQEAIEKWTILKEKYSHLPLKLHLIGSLQTNKVKEAVALFDVIEVIDRPKLLVALKKEMDRQQRYPACLIQVNIGEEPQKSGVMPQELPQLIALAQKEQVTIEGLMCIPPQHGNAALYFGLLVSMAKEAHLHTLSMGMSGDYEHAIMMGATHIRLGTAIFGER